jgi:hypothetical protein
LFIQRSWPVHVVNHLAAMGDLHRAGRFDRLSDDVLTLTGQRPLSVQEFVLKNAATFTHRQNRRESLRPLKSIRVRKGCAITVTQNLSWLPKLTSVTIRVC